MRDNKFASQKQTTRKQQANFSILISYPFQLSIHDSQALVFLISCLLCLQWSPCEHGFVLLGGWNTSRVKPSHLGKGNTDNSNSTPYRNWTYLKTIMSRLPNPLGQRCFLEKIDQYKKLKIALVFAKLGRETPYRVKVSRNIVAALSLIVYANMGKKKKNSFFCC